MSTPIDRQFHLVRKYLKAWRANPNYVTLAVYEHHLGVLHDMQDALHLND